MFHLDEKKLQKRANNLLHNPLLIILAVAVTSSLLISTTRLEKKVTIIDNGKSITISTYKAVVKDILNSINVEIGSKDKVFPGLNASAKQNMVINIKRAVPINVAVDGRQLKINTAEDSVSDMLKAEGIVLNDKDKISPAKSDSIEKGMNIKIVRVVEKTVVSAEAIPYTTTNKLDDDIEQGVTKTVQNGQDGEKEISTKVVYEDGVEVSRTKIGETVKNNPVNKIIAIGTLAWFTASRGGGSRKLYYTRQLHMRATAYTSNYSCTGKNPGDYGFGITVTGATASRASNTLSGWSTVAVDPSVIPLGSKLYVEGYGLAIAEDVGGGVKGNSIDLYFNNNSDINSWGMKYVNVYVLKNVN